MVITVYGHEAVGHIITLMIQQTSAGATLETFTIPAGSPAMDLSKAHPIVSGWFCSLETDTAKDSVVMLPSKECQRGSVVDAKPEWAIQTSTTLTFYNEIDKDGILFITYWAAGARQY